MHTRWRLLFFSALSALIGVAWLAEAFHMSMLRWLNVQLLGMILAAIVSFAALVTNTRRRWPAAVALICAGPMAQGLYHALKILPDFLRLTRTPGVLMIVGSLGAIVA